MARFTLFILLLLTFYNTSFAQSKTIEAQLKEQVSVSVQPNESLSQIDIIYSYSHKQSQPLGFNLTVSGPKGAKISMGSIGYPQGKSPAVAYSTSRALNTVELAVEGGKLSKQIVLGKKVENTPKKNTGGGSGTVCNGQLSAQYVDAYANIVASLWGRNPTLAELCDYLFPPEVQQPGASTPTATNGASTEYAQILGVLYTDACTKNATILAVVSINLADVSAEDKALGFTVQVSLDGDDYDGSKAFKVKKIGDGMFKKPLLLASMVGGGSVSAEHHIFSRWSGGKIKTFNKLKIAKTTFYRGLFLGVSLPGRNLSGGKATVYVTNGARAYGVCINARASDQLYNGYTN